MTPIESWIGADLFLSALRFLLAGPLAYWHLLSLDAPTVSTVWVVFVARVSGVRLPWTVACAMFLAVWAIYAADRLLDARRQQNLEARHRFHGRYWAAFSVALALVAVALPALVAVMPRGVRDAYLVLGGLLVVWFGLVHLVRPRRMPKEIVVGLFFSAAVFLPSISHAAVARLIVPALFAANLCSLNCLFIYAWEHPQRNASKPHTTTVFGLRRLRGIAVASIALPIAAIPLAVNAAPILLACSLGAAYLVLLHRLRMRMDRTTLRAAADLALLSPLLLLPFLR